MDKRRRDFLSNAAVATLAGLSLPGTDLRAAMRGQARSLSMQSDGAYATVPLAKPEIRLGVIQSRVRGVSASNPERGRRDNLAHMLELIDNAFHFGARPDILFFHEFPITGFNAWNRKEILKVAIEIPGPETEEVAKKAKQYGCYIVFGSYARDADWPNHVLSITTIMSPAGKIVDRHWKARNIKGIFPGIELFTTTVYDVLDQYVEMYGEDAVIPVTRTPYGNIATSSVQLEPELFRAFAMKGAEIILRTATGGFTPLDMQGTSLYNGVYTAVCNNAVSPDNPGFFDDASSGGSTIYAPGGDMVAAADTKFETMITARIPIEEFRSRHRQPMVHMELYQDIFQRYRSPYAPNLFINYQPTDLRDSKRYLKDKSRW